MGVFIAAIRYLSIKTFLSSALQAYGGMWLVVQVAAFFSSDFSERAKAYGWLFLLIGSLYGLFRALPRLSVSAVIADTDCSITIRVCDLFAVNGVAYVINTNTTFDTAMEDGTIDASSVQGQLTTRLCSSREQLDRDIAHSLEGVPSTTVSPQEKSYGKLQRYEIGTVASIPVQKKRAYLVAVATMNANKVAQARRRDVQDALLHLWEYIRTRGQLDTLCCPILGSGFSRINATREELIHEIVRSFIPAVKAGTFCRGLLIAVSPQDFREGHLDLERLRQFLQHECAYGSSALGASSLPTTGTSVHIRDELHVGLHDRGSLPPEPEWRRNLTAAETALQEEWVPILDVDMKWERTERGLNLAVINTTPVTIRVLSWSLVNVETWSEEHGQFVRHEQLHLKDRFTEIELVLGLAELYTNTWKSLEFLSLDGHQLVVTGHDKRTSEFRKICIPKTGVWRVTISYSTGNATSNLSRCFYWKQEDQVPEPLKCPQQRNWKPFRP